MSRGRAPPTPEKPTPPTGSILPPGIVGGAIRASPLPRWRWTLYRLRLRTRHSRWQAERNLEDRATAAPHSRGRTPSLAPASSRGDHHLANALASLPRSQPIRRCKTKRCHPEDDRRHGGDGELRYAVRTPQRGDVAVRTRRGDWAAPRLSSSMSVATKPSTAVAGARFSARAFPSRCAARTPGVRSNSLRRRRRRSLDGSHRDLAEAGAHRLRPIVSAGDRSGPGRGTRSAEGTRVHRAST